jgi:hypothetical protein
MKINYKKNDWVVMTEYNTQTFDELCLPTFEKITLTIMRRVSEPERKKYHEDRAKFGSGIPVTYEELTKLL